MKFDIGRLFGAKPDADPTQEQRLAVAQLLFEIARADLGVSPPELAAMRRHLQTAYRLDESALEALLSRAAEKAERSVSLYETVQAINQSQNAEQKAELIGALWQVAHADQQLDPHEEALLRRLADLLYVPHSVFIREKLKTLGNDA